jgi:MFS-type transporter involved in bile tolerance (Atg22 family)
MLLLAFITGFTTHLVTAGVLFITALALFGVCYVLHITEAPKTEEKQRHFA